MFFNDPVASTLITRVGFFVLLLKGDVLEQRTNSNCLLMFSAFSLKMEAVAIMAKEVAFVSLVSMIIGAIVAGSITAAVLVGSRLYPAQVGGMVNEVALL